MSYFFAVSRQSFVVLPWQYLLKCDKYMVSWPYDTDLFRGRSPRRRRGRARGCKRGEVVALAEDLGGGELRVQSIQIDWWTLSCGARVAVALAPQRDNSLNGY